MTTIAAIETDTQVALAADKRINIGESNYKMIESKITKLSGWLYLANSGSGQLDTWISENPLKVKSQPLDGDAAVKLVRTWLSPWHQSLIDSKVISPQSETENPTGIFITKWWIGYLDSIGCISLLQRKAGDILVVTDGAGGDAAYGAITAALKFDPSNTAEWYAKFGVQISSEIFEHTGDGIDTAAFDK